MTEGWNNSKNNFSTSTIQIAEFINSVMALGSRYMAGGDVIDLYSYTASYPQDPRNSYTYRIRACELFARGDQGIIQTNFPDFGPNEHDGPDHFSFAVYLVLKEVIMREGKKKRLRSTVIALRSLYQIWIIMNLIMIMMAIATLGKAGRLRCHFACLLLPEPSPAALE